MDKYGPAGAILFCLFLFGYVMKVITDKALDRHDKAMKSRDDAASLQLGMVIASHEKTMATISGELKGLSANVEDGFTKLHDALEKRDDQQQGLFDKHLDVTVKVTESLGGLGVKLADNTKEIAELKSAIRELRGEGGGPPKRPRT